MLVDIGAGCLFQVEYYTEATGADNHAVREAACACIAELGAKVYRCRTLVHLI